MKLRLFLNGLVFSLSLGTALVAKAADSCEKRPNAIECQKSPYCELFPTSSDCRPK